jgi:hypothetical protein
MQILASPNLFSNVKKPITKISCVLWQSSQQHGANYEKKKNYNSLYVYTVNIKLYFA